MANDSTATDPPAAPPSRLLAYLRLMRAPNVFTALADVSMGLLVVQGGILHIPQFVLLLLASGLLYSAGMVLNDVYDLEIDRQERPQRPLPSGQIPVRAAYRLGYGLLLGGLAAGWCTGLVVGGTAGIAIWRPGVVASLLAAAILLYDGLLKVTWLGPPVMGSCRLLNVLLGMSAAQAVVEPAAAEAAGVLGFAAWQWMIALGIGTYVTGITWFARGEAATSGRFTLTLGLTHMLAGLGMLALFPQLLSEGRQLHLDGQSIWPLALLFLTIPIVRRSALALTNPTADQVQDAVKHAIMSLIMLDAALAFTLAHWPFALGILALIVPARLLGRWVYST